MATKDEVLKKLKTMARPDQIEGMTRFGITPDNRLGVSVPDLRRMARDLGRDHDLALGLWKSGVPEARILAAMVAEPAKLTEAQMEAWVADFDSWDVCDQVCLNLFDRSPLAWKKVHDWSKRREEYVRRAAYALIACLAWHDRESADERFARFLPVVKSAATDERNYVKKAVNWALRGIGKRSPRLNRAALKTAQEIKRLDSKAARWIAADAIRELTSEAVEERLKGRFQQTARKKTAGR